MGTAGRTARPALRIAREAESSQQLRSSPLFIPCITSLALVFWRMCTVGRSRSSCVGVATKWAERSPCRCFMAACRWRSTESISLSIRGRSRGEIDSRTQPDRSTTAFQSLARVAARGRPVVAFRAKAKILSRGCFRGIARLIRAVSVMLPGVSALDQMDISARIKEERRWRSVHSG